VYAKKISHDRITLAMIASLNGGHTH